MLEGQIIKKAFYPLLIICLSNIVNIIYLTQANLISK